MIKIHIKRHGMWRKVYAADAWTLAAHGLWALAALFGAVSVYLWVK